MYNTLHNEEIPHDFKYSTTKLISIHQGKIIFQQPEYTAPITHLCRFRAKYLHINIIVVYCLFEWGVDDKRNLFFVVVILCIFFSKPVKPVKLREKIVYKGVQVP